MAVLAYNLLLRPNGQMAASPECDRRRGLRTSLDEGSINAYSEFRSLHVSGISRVSTCKNPRGRTVVVKEYFVQKLSEADVKQARL